jgi:hypothetical protein
LQNPVAHGETQDYLADREKQQLRMSYESFRDVRVSPKFPGSMPSFWQVINGSFWNFAYFRSSVERTGARSVWHIYLRTRILRMALSAWRTWPIQTRTREEAFVAQVITLTFFHDF